MSREEAEEWIKDSDVKESVYHGTTKEAVESIKKEGFEIPETNAYGKGVYLGNKNVANTYGDNAVEAKVNVRKAYEFKDDLDLMNKLQELDEAGKINGIIDFDGFQKYLKENGYDAMKIGENNPYYLVFDPKRVTAIDETPK